MNSLGIAATAATILFATSFISFWRLKLLGVLSLENQNKSRAAKIEKSLHAFASLALVILCVGAMARAILYPAYPGGLTAIDGPLASSAAVNIISSVPAAGLIVLLSQDLSAGKTSAPNWQVLSGFIISTVFAGAGQTLTAGLASRVSSEAMSDVTPTTMMFAIGAGIVLTASVVGGYFVKKKIILKSQADIPLIAMHSMIVAIPTVLAISLAAIGLRLQQ